MATKTLKLKSVYLHPELYNIVYGHPNSDVSRECEIIAQILNRVAKVDSNLRKNKGIRILELGSGPASKYMLPLEGAIEDYTQLTVTDYLKTDIAIDAKDGYQWDFTQDWSHGAVADIVLLPYFLIDTIQDPANDWGGFTLAQYNQFFKSIESMLNPGGYVVMHNPNGYDIDEELDEGSNGVWTNDKLITTPAWTKILDTLVELKAISKAQAKLADLSESKCKVSHRYVFNQFYRYSKDYSTLLLDLRTSNADTLINIKLVFDSPLVYSSIPIPYRIGNANLQLQGMYTGEDSTILYEKVQEQPVEITEDYQHADWLVLHKPVKNSK